MFKGVVFFIKNGWKYDKRYVVWKLLHQLINSTIPIVMTIIPKLIIDELMGACDLKKIFFYVGIITLYVLVASVLSNYFNWDGFTRRCKVAAEFDSELHKRLVEADIERLETPDFLDMQEKSKKFIYCDWHGFGYLLDSAISIIGQFITIIGIATIIATLDWKIVIAFFVLVFLSCKIESRAKKEAIKLSKEIVMDQRGWSYYAELFEKFEYGKEIRINNLGRWLLSREREYFVRVNKNLKSQNDNYIKSGSIGAFFAFIQQVITYSYLIFSVINKSISIGSFTMYIGAVSTFSAALKNVIDSLAEIKAYDMYYDDLDKYIKIPQKLRRGKLIPDISQECNFEFKNVSFRYPGCEKYVIQNINFTMSCKEKIAIVGENGAGKTTFVKLLARLYDPCEGQILLNGIDIKEYDYESYMSLFSTVFQDYKLFSFSIKENVALSLPIDEEKIERILKDVGFGEKLDKLSNGINTSIYKNFDENGFDPSGGEGQKIALARALYKDAKIVILDEPTAAMDPRAEYDLYSNFNKLVQGKLAMYISHRLSSARFCDKIMVLKNGKIEECGSHDELIKNDGLYKELFTMQAQYYLEDL